MRSETDEDLVIYRHRKLPHWEAGGKSYFVTFTALRPLSDRARSLLVQRLPAIRPDWVTIHLGIVMPDHVHLLLTPAKSSEESWHSLGAILQALKGVSAREINVTENRTGSIWQKESYDHLIRNEQDWTEKADYIWRNPVDAGLCALDEDYPWMIADSTNYA